MSDHATQVLSQERIALQKKITAELHLKIDVKNSLSLLLEETKDGQFDGETLKLVLRDLNSLLRPNNEYTQPIDDETRLAALGIMTNVVQFSSANRVIVEDSGTLGTSLFDLLSLSSSFDSNSNNNNNNNINNKIQEQVTTFIHYLSRSQQLSSRLAKPWALNPLVTLFVSCDNMNVLDHLAACFANLAPLDNLNIIGKQEVIDRIAYLLKNGSEHGKENSAYFICNYLTRKDTVTYMIIKSGIPEILIELLRHQHDHQTTTKTQSTTNDQTTTTNTQSTNSTQTTTNNSQHHGQSTNISEKGKKPILASLGMLAETSVEMQSCNVKMGVLAPVLDILTESKNHELQELCLDLLHTHGHNHDINKMQILTAGFMEPLQAKARAFREDSKGAQRSLRAMATISDCKMFSSIFGLPKLALFADVLRSGDNLMIQCSTVILLHMAESDPEFKEAILGLGLVELIKEYSERLGGDAKTQNPVFQDFILKMQKTNHNNNNTNNNSNNINNNNNNNDSGWFSSVSNYIWSSGGAFSAKVFAPTVHPSSWTVTEVCDWLKRYWFSQYTETFSKHLINGALLLDLNDSDLQDLGVTDKFHRRSILKQIEVLKQG